MNLSRWLRNTGSIRDDPKAVGKIAPGVVVQSIAAARRPGTLLQRRKITPYINQRLRLPVTNCRLTVAGQLCPVGNG